jgi:hypothetical protein
VDRDDRQKDKAKIKSLGLPMGQQRKRVERQLDGCQGDGPVVANGCIFCRDKSKQCKTKRGTPRLPVVLVLMSLFVVKGETMGNMSYCRFENTALDMQECADALEAMMEGEDDCLSERERRGLKIMLEIMGNIIANVADHLNVDYEKVLDEMMDNPDRLEEQLNETFTGIYQEDDCDE